MPAIEIGWRLARRSWGQGLASEAAAAVVNHAFTALGLPALVSFTAEWNRPSRRVMEKCGLTFVRAFHRPDLDPVGKDGVVEYALARAQWAASASPA